MNTDQLKREFLIAAGLVALCVAVRLGVYEGALPYNFAAVASAGLFAGSVLRSKLIALGVPVVSMLAADALIGFSPVTTMIVVYAALTAPMFVGRWLRTTRWSVSLRFCALGMTAVGASLLFYVMTNLETWIMWGMYPRSAAGLLSCYVAALPFFKWTLASNLLFTFGLFGLHAAARARAAAPALSTAA